MSGLEFGLRQACTVTREEYYRLTKNRPSLDWPVAHSRTASGTPISTPTFNNVELIA